MSGTEDRSVLAGLSHELRAPLQAMLGYLDVLGGEALGPLNDDQREAVSGAVRSAERVLAIARDVLEVARIDAGREPSEPSDVDLREILDREIEEARALAQDRGLGLEIDCPESLRIRTDPRKVSRIVANLLSNALKYTDEGQVTLCAGCERGWGFIEVVDTGPGIPSERHEAVFTEYVRLHDDRPGTGLGLPIVRRLATLLGGRLELESAPGRGTRIRLDLPLDPANP